jgi:exonuclease III
VSLNLEVIRTKWDDLLTWVTNWRQDMLALQENCDLASKNLASEYF